MKKEIKYFLKPIPAIIVIIVIGFMAQNSLALMYQTQKTSKMTTKKVLKKTISIDASTAEVWNALTNPAVIKEWLYGTSVNSEWEVGSQILFTGDWEGTSYSDKGTILEFDIEKTFSYSYWSSFSSLPDSPENYSVIKFSLRAEAAKTVLTLTQSNFATEEAYEHSDKNWEETLQLLKNIIESK